MNNEEKINKKLLDDLKNLPKVSAPKNFETELFRKINSSEPEKKKSIWDRILTPTNLAPAAIAIVSAAIIFFVIDISPGEMEDPLNMAPRLREDIIVIESIEDIPIEQLNETKEVEKKSTETKKELNNTRGIEKPKQRTEVYNKSIDERSGEVGESIIDDLVLSKSDSENIITEGAQNLGGISAPTAIHSEISDISKDNLNFMQRNLSSEEKMKVRQLKMKVQSEKTGKLEQKANKLP